MIERWRFDEADDEHAKSRSRGAEEVSAPLEHLEELKNSDYKMSDSQHGVYGWKVLDAGREKVGIMKDFLFDKTEERIRYLIVSLEEGDLKKEEKNILIPIGKAELNLDKKHVVLTPNITSEKLAELPAFNSVRSLAIEDEKKTVLAFSDKQKEEVEYTKQNFYKSEDFDEMNFFGSDDKQQI